MRLMVMTMISLDFFTSENIYDNKDDSYYMVVITLLEVTNVTMVRATY